MVRAVISTDSAHLQGNVVDICTAGYVEYSIIQKRKKQLSKGSTVAPVVPNIEDLKPVQL